MLRSKVRLGVAAAVLAAALTLAGGTLAGAHWAQSRDLAVPAITTGNLAVTSAWVEGTPAWGPLLPGESAEATLRVNIDSTGTTAGSRLHLTGQVTPTASQHAVVGFSVGNCSVPSRPAFPTSGYPATGYLHGTDVVEVCVRVTLDAQAPNSLQGTDLEPEVVATLQQHAGA